MDKDNLEQNKLPGCDQFTRPEEIKALGKYLGHIKKVQEEHTSLINDNLEIPGRTTGNLDKIDSLREKLEKLDSTNNLQSINLLGEDKRVNLDKRNSDNHDRLGSELIQRPNLENKNDSIIILPETKLGIDDNKTVTKLNTSKVDLKDNIEIEKLPNESSILQDIKESSLDNTRVDITDSLDISLSTKKEIIEVKEKLELPDEVEKLDNSTEHSKLSNKSIILGNINEVNELSETKLNIDNDDKIKNLPESNIILDNSNEDALSELNPISIPLDNIEEIDNLNTYIKYIDSGNKTDDIDSLYKGAHLLDIDFSDIKLSDSILDIPDAAEDKLELESKIIEIEQNTVESLSDENIVIPGKTIDPKLNKELPIEIPSEIKETSLSNTILNIEDDKETNLSDTILNIEDDKKVDLSDTILSIENDKEINLSDTKLSIEDDKEVNLSDTKLSIEDDKEVNLSDTILNIEDDKKETSLSDTKLSIEDDKEVNLSDTILSIENDKEVNLSDTILSIEDDKEVNLSDTILNIEDVKETSLSDTKLSIEDDKETNLSDTILNIENDKEVDLSDTKLSIERSKNDKWIDPNVEGNELYDAIIGIGEDKSEFFKNPSATIETLIDTTETKSNKVRTAESSKVKVKAAYSNIKAITDKYKTKELLESKNDEWIDPNAEGNELSDTKLSIEKSKNDEWIDPDVEENELSDAIIELEDNKSKFFSINPNATVETLIDTTETKSNKVRTAESSKVKVKAAYSNIKAITDKYKTERLTPNDEQGGNHVEYIDPNNYSDLDKYGKFLKENKNLISSLGGFGEKIVSAASTYLGGSNNISQEKASEYRNKLIDFANFLDKIKKSGAGLGENENTVNRPDYKSPDTNLLTFTPNAYIRWIAENTVGKVGTKSSEVRELLLDETLALLVLARDALERSTKSNRDRLPGDDLGLAGDILSGGNSISSIAQKGVGRAVDQLAGKNINRNNPINRPKEDKEVTGWVSANHRQTVTGATTQKKLKLGEKLKNALLGGSKEEDYKFKDEYLKGEGIKLTLDELCLPSNIESVDSLFNTLRNSPYITTPEKFTTSKYGNCSVTTLDSNNHWEIIFEPYVGTLNGSRSYLPAIWEINSWNYKYHGATTAYNRWIPFTSFDLQKSRLNNKSIGLYDGEFVIPSSIEFINEFRLSIADDQYKSWRSYFEMCKDVSIYSSDAHDKEYYDNPKSTYLTSIDKTHPLVAMYKNVTFRCVIYTMTPQKSTIRKFDLLLVLKNFSEEHTGEIDAGGGGDLNVTFSIVGENPTEAIIPSYAGDKLPNYGEENMSLTLSRSEIDSTASILKSAGSSVMSLLM